MMEIRLIYNFMIIVQKYQEMNILLQMNGILLKRLQCVMKNFIPVVKNPILICKFFNFNFPILLFTFHFIHFQRTFYLMIKRRGGFYNYILVLPCVLLSCLTMVRSLFRSFLFKIYVIKHITGFVLVAS